jgi:leucyl aminopeptidase
LSISFELTRQPPADIELLALPVLADDQPSDGESEADLGLGLGLDGAFLQRRGFDGKLGQVQSLPGELGIVVLAIGMGPAAEVDADVFRRAGAAIARHAKRHRVVATTVLDVVPDAANRRDLARALAEGMSLAAYSFTSYKSDAEGNRIERAVVVGTGGKRVQEALDLGSRVADAVVFARDLVNEPGGSLTPRRLAQAAIEMAEREDLQVSVLDEADIAEAGMGGLLGVNRGSEEPPRFIELCYEPARPRGTVALVGKGITFDSGGLSIKTSDGMSTMKDDMGGAASVLGAMSAVSAVKPPVRVRAYIPSTDNMTGGDATRPGDVLRIRDGQTVEVLNTDAEGRLILADALSLAGEAEPDAIIDVATLTGACMVALGTRVAGLMGNDPAWIEQVTAAAVRTGERVWELPLPSDYRRQLDSDVADLRNIGGSRHGGALVAGLFLQEFVPEDIPWAHLDIAGTAWSDVSEGVVAKGGTGFGVRLLLDLLKHFRRP